VHNAFRKNQRISHGAMASILMVRHVVHDAMLIARHKLSSITYHPYRYLFLVLSTVCHILHQIYSSLSLSRTRYEQWRVDLTFIITSIFRVLDSIDSCQSQAVDQSRYKWMAQLERTLLIPISPKGFFPWILTADTDAYVVQRKM
jgi:hypothetical protein